MSPATRTSHVKTIKPQVLQMGGLVGVPAVWLDKLPATPQELQASQPDLYASVYGQAAPAASPFDHIQWNLLVNGTKCRTRRDFGELSLALNPFSSGSASSGHGRDSGAAFKLQQMQQQLQQLQQQFENRTLQNGPSQELTLQFPNYAGTPRRGDSGTLNLPPEPARTQEAARQSLPPTSLPALPHPALPPTTLPPTSLPPPAATISSASAVEERGDEADGTSEKLTVPPPLGGPAAEPANPKKRMSVAETTAALLAKISAPKGTAESAKPKEKKSEKKKKKKNKKEKKKKNKGKKGDEGDDGFL